jgi:hypothetical protein
MKKMIKVVEVFQVLIVKFHLHPRKKNFILCWRLHLKMTNGLFALRKPNDRFLTQLSLKL